MENISTLRIIDLVVDILAAVC